MLRAPFYLHLAAKAACAGSVRRAVTMLLSGAALAAGALTYTGAQAQCTGNATQFNGSSSLNALTAAIGTVNTAFLTGGSAFVVSVPNSAPDQLGGGVWVRAIGGTADTEASTNFNGSFRVTPPAGSVYTDDASIACHTKTDQDFVGFQAGHDIAFLNTGGSGASWHFGALAGYVGADVKDATPGISGSSMTGNFDAPFAGLYTAFSKGNFYADGQARLDYFQGESSGQRVDARGYSITGNAGYRLDLGGNWNLEPSVGGVFSRTSVDPLDVSGTLVTSVPALTGEVSVPVSGILQIHDVESALGRASIKLNTSFVMDGGQIVAYPFVTASVFHEFAGDVSASIASSGTIPAPPYGSYNFQGGGILTASRIGTYAQFGAGSAFQFADTGWLGYAREDYRTGDNIQGITVNAGLRYQLNPETASLKDGSSLKDGPAESYWPLCGRLRRRHVGRHTLDVPRQCC